MPTIQDTEFLVYEQVQVGHRHPIVALRGLSVQITELMGHGVVFKTQKPISGQEYFFGLFGDLVKHESL